MLVQLIVWTLIPALLFIAAVVYHTAFNKPANQVNSSLMSTDDSDFDPDLQEAIEQVTDLVIRRLTESTSPIRNQQQIGSTEEIIEQVIQKLSSDYCINPVSQPSASSSTQTTARQVNLQDMSEIKIHVDANGDFTVPFDFDALNRSMSSRRSSFAIKAFGGGLLTTKESFGIDDTTKFIEEYEQGSRMLEWDTRTTALRFPQFLAEPAKTWYRLEVTSTVAQEWSLLKAVFERKFIPQGKQQKAAEQFQSRKQGPTESVLEYHLAMADLFKEAAMTDQFLQQLFLRRGLDQRIQTLIDNNLAQPRDVEQLIVQAEIAERLIRKQTHPLPTPNNTTVAAINSIEQVHTTADNRALDTIITKLDQLMIPRKESTEQWVDGVNYADNRKDRPQFNRSDNRSHPSNSDRSRSRDQRSNGRGRSRERSRTFSGRDHSYDRNSRHRPRSGSNGRRVSFSKERSSSRDGQWVETRTCFYCDKKGHIAANCFTKKKNVKERRDGSTDRSSKRKFSQVSHVEFDGEDSDDYDSVGDYAVNCVSGQAETNNLVLDVSVDEVKGRALVDTGAGPSLISAAYFQQTGQPITPYTGNPVAVADKTKMEITGRARLNVLITLGGQTKTIQHKFLITPSLAFDLILGRKFNTKANFNIDCSTNQVTFKSSKELIPAIKLNHVVSAEDVIVRTLSHQVRSQPKLELHSSGSGDRRRKGCPC